MGGPNRGRMRYDLVAGAEMVAAYGLALTDFEARTEIDRWVGQDGQSGSFDGFLSAFADYRRQVNGRIGEQRRVGALLEQAIAGKHEVLTQTALRSSGSGSGAPGGGSDG